jgi:hypothetical protein
MTYQRKTVDEYRLFVNYGEGGGWEHEITEFSWRALMTRVKEYRANCPYPIKYRKVRIRKDDCEKET